MEGGTAHNTRNTPDLRGTMDGRNSKDEPHVSPVVSALIAAVHETVTSMSRLMDFTWLTYNDELAFIVHGTTEWHIRVSCRGPESLEKPLCKLTEIGRGDERTLPWPQETIITSVPVNAEMINECTKRWRGSGYDQTAIPIMYTRSGELRSAVEQGPPSPSETNKIETTRLQKHYVYSLKYICWDAYDCREHYFHISRSELAWDSMLLPMIPNASKFGRPSNRFFLEPAKGDAQNIGSVEIDGIPSPIGPIIQDLCQFTNNSGTRFCISDSRDYRSRICDKDGLMEWFVRVDERSRQIYREATDGDVSPLVEWSPIIYDDVWKAPLGQVDLARALQHDREKSSTRLGIYWNTRDLTYDQITLLRVGNLSCHFGDGSSNHWGGSGVLLFIERLSLDRMLPRVAVEHRIKWLSALSKQMSDLLLMPVDLSDVIVSFVF